MKILGIKLSILLLIFLSAVYAAAEPRLVKDINPGGDSYPQYLTNVNGTLFFTADDGIHGWALWKSDGTAAGTVIVKDINPSGSSFPYYLTNVNGKLFFTADDGTCGWKLWVLVGENP